MRVDKVEFGDAIRPRLPPLDECVDELTKGVVEASPLSKLFCMEAVFFSMEIREWYRHMRELSVGMSHEEIIHHLVTREKRAFERVFLSTDAMNITFLRGNPGMVDDFSGLIFDRPFLPEVSTPSTRMLTHSS